MTVASSRMTGARCLAEMVHGYGVSHVFFVPTFMLSAHAEMNRLGIRTISTHGEKAAAYMADGYARVTGRPGVCMAQTVGAALLAAGLKDAYMAGSPIIAFTGGPDVETRFRHVYQEIDDHAMFAVVTKWNASIEDVTRLPELLRQAFRAATAGAPGPVHLQMRGHLGEIVEAEANLQPLVEPAFAQTPGARSVADAEPLAAAARALATAESPVIVAGGGVISSQAEPELVELAEKLDIPIATSLNAKAAIAEAHPLSVGVVGVYSPRCANEVVSRADLVFFVGSRTGSMVTNNWQVPAPGVRVIHLDINAEELGRHYPAEVALHGDAKASLRQLIDVTAPRTNERWTSEVQELVERWRSEVRPMMASNAVPIRPERICAEIAAALPADGAVVVDTLQASIWAGSMISLKGSSQRFARCAGSLGWALPAAIGAKCALGDRPVICFTGDGGAYYHLAELETAARYGVNVVVVVNNNGAYAGEEAYWDTAYGDESSFPHWKFGDINFAQVAQELGCLGTRVQKPEKLGDALRRALASSRPTLIDVVSDFSAYHPKGWAP
ncbi:MAG: thiamine pyrophosphate-binding protein [Dehalococcoidia bacterium]